MIRGKKFKAKRFSRFSRLLGIVLIILIAIGLVQEINNRRQIQQKIASLEAEIGQAQRENSDLSGLIASGQDRGYLEKEARLKLGLQKPGEKVILILKPDADNSSDTLIDPTQKIIGKELTVKPLDERSNLIKWRDYFFKH